MKEGHTNNLNKFQLWNLLYITFSRTQPSHKMRDACTNFTKDLLTSVTLLQELALNKVPPCVHTFFLVDCLASHVMTTGHSKPCIAEEVTELFLGEVVCPDGRINIYPQVPYIMQSHA